MNIKYIISLSALVALTGVSCWGVSVYWEDTDMAKDFPVGTDVASVKKNFPLYPPNLLEVKVNKKLKSGNYKLKKDNYKLKKGDQVKIWPKQVDGQGGEADSYK